MKLAMMIFHEEVEVNLVTSVKVKILQFFL